MTLLLKPNVYYRNVKLLVFNRYMCIFHICLLHFILLYSVMSLSAKCLYLLRLFIIEGYEQTHVGVKDYFIKKLCLLECLILVLFFCFF